MGFDLRTYLLLGSQDLVHEEDGSGCQLWKVGIAVPGKEAVHLLLGHEPIL